MKKLTNLFGPVIFILLFIQLWNILYKYECYIALIFPLFLLVIITYSFVDIRLQKKECFSECYLIKGTLISNILTKKVFLLFIFTVFSILLTISTMYLMIDYKDTMILYLSIYIISITLFYHALVHLLRNSVREKYLLLFSKEITMNVFSVISIGFYAYLLLYSSTPEYLDTDFNKTLEKASMAVYSECLYLNELFGLKVKIDSIFWWGTSTLSEYFSNKILRGVLWGIFITFNSLAILGVNRFISQIVYLVYRQGDKNG